MSLLELESRIKATYERCASHRSGLPVFGLEHGLEAHEIADVKAALGQRLRSHSSELALDPFPFCLVACSSEIGYDYRGTGTDFWPRFEAEIGAEFDESGRKAHTRAFEFAHKNLGLKAPVGTPWTRNFRHIAWPVTNAIAAREVHRPLAVALRRAMAFAFADSSVEDLVARLRIEARSQQNTRLTEWLEVSDVPAALVARLLNIPLEEGTVEAVSLDRIIEDLEADPVARHAVAAASARRKVARPRGELPKFRLRARIDFNSSVSFSLRVPDLDPQSLAILVTELARSGGVVSLAPPGMELRLSELVPAGDLMMSAEMLHSVISGEVPGFLDPAGNSPTLNEQLGELMPAVSDPLFLVEESRDGFFIEWPTDRKIPASRRIVVVTSRTLPDLEAMKFISDLGELKLFEVDAANQKGRTFLANANLFIDQDPVFDFLGGIQIGEGVRGPVFARGMPVLLKRRDLEGGGDWSVRTADTGTIELSPQEIAVVLDETRERHVLEARTDAGRAVSEVQFYDVESPPSSLAIRFEPSSPSVEDIARGRLGLEIDSPLELSDIPLTVGVASGTGEIVSSTGTLEAIPASIADTVRIISELSEKLADAFPARSSRLYLEVSLGGLWRHRQPLEWDPVPVHWHRDGGCWRAISETGELELFRSTGQAPLVQTRCEGAIAGDDVFSILLPTVQSEPVYLGAICDGPRQLELGTIEPQMPSQVLRTLDGYPDKPGFRDTVEGYVLWSCARPTHSVASLVARTVASEIEKTVVVQLCGKEWGAAEARSHISSGSLHDVLASQALEFGQITEDEIPPIPEALRRTFLVIFSAKIQAAWPILPQDPDQIDFELFADRMAEAAADAYEEFSSHVAGPEAENFEDAYPYSEPGKWKSAHHLAVDRMSGRLMSRLILPAERGRQLQDWDYAQASSRLISLLSDLHVDLSPRGQKRWVSASHLQDCFQLWTEPSEILKKDQWLESISRFLQDRQSARAVRYAALRYRAARSLALYND